ncbi:MAG: PTS sugar transporter subunit IIA [Spirochaetes bacterium]|nr:PTS sugar transporter subunit IIA [Spirochaetota bacterium]MBU1079776.1 PTS sugar transporter subunit IIA [Spirochaetota bacterium]
MIAELEYLPLLVPFLAYLVARGLASALERRLPSCSAAALAALGAASAALWAGLRPGALLLGGAYPALADAASVAGTMALGLGARSVSTGSRAGSVPVSPRWRRAAALASPGLAAAALSAALAMGPGSPGGAGLLSVARAAGYFAAALWLSGGPGGAGGPGGPGTIAAIAAMTLASTPWRASAALVALGLGVAMAAASRLERGRHGPGLPFPLLSPALSVALLWALRTAGLPWPAAGLVAGYSLLFQRRSADGKAFATPARVSAGSMRRAASKEAGYALAFVAGLGAWQGVAAGEWPSALAVCVAFLASSAVRAALSGSGSSFLPVGAAAFAALIAAERAGLASGGATAGMALAYLVAVPLSRGRAMAALVPTVRSPVKAIVGVPASGPTLEALSFAQAIGERGSSIRAACVSPTDGTSPSPGEAEDALIRCVAAGASAEIPVLPSVVVSSSVPDGLARAALERRADAVILEMQAGFRPVVAGQGPVAANRKRTLEGLLDAFSGSVIALGGSRPISSAQRLVAMTVAGAETVPGFAQALEATSRAWGRPGSSMRGVMIGAPASALVDASAGLLDERATVAVDSWRDAAAIVDERSSQDTAFVVFSSRPGAEAWNPGHERLPVVLESAYPGSALAVWFLPRAVRPDAPGDDLASATGPDERRWPPIVAAAFSSGRIQTGMREAALVDAIRRLTDSVFPGDRGAAGRLASEFSGIARTEPIELAAGVLLLHARASGLVEPTLAIGARPSGWPLVALSSPVRIAVALVSPVDSGPEAHLEALTQIATAFRNQGLADRLLSPPDSSL